MLAARVYTVRATGLTPARPVSSTMRLATIALACSWLAADVVSQSAYGRISLRDATISPVPVALCLDSAGADNENPVKTTECAQNSSSQLFSYESTHQFIVLKSTNCVQGAPCCVENWNGECTVFSCSDMPGIKAWAYSNDTGHLSNGGQCMTASGEGGGVSASACRQQDANQMWRLEQAGSLPPPGPPPPGADKCAAMGCPQNWTPGLPCQCNPDCERYGNCCADKEKVCGRAPPSPAPWPCRTPPCPSPSPPWTPPSGCTSIAGQWAAVGDTVSIAQSGCSFVATDKNQTWSPAKGSFQQRWQVEMAFSSEGVPVQ